MEFGGDFTSISFDLCEEIEGISCVFRKVKERVDAKNAFDGYVHSMRSATEGSGDNKGLSATWLKGTMSVCETRTDQECVRI